jgi:hypothetical protein
LALDVVELQYASRYHKLRRAPEADEPEGHLSSSSPNYAAGTHQNLGAMLSEPT